MYDNFLNEWNFHGVHFCATHDSFILNQLRHFPVHPNSFWNALGKNGKHVLHSARHISLVFFLTRTFKIEIVSLRNVFNSCWNFGRYRVYLAYLFWGLHSVWVKYSGRITDSDSATKLYRKLISRIHLYNCSYIWSYFQYIFKSFIASASVHGF